MTPLKRMRQRPLQKQWPVGRVCKTAGCSTVLSRYNDDTVCASCYGKIPLVKLPTTIGRYL